MQGDMSNAYGSTSRLEMLEAVRRHVPSVVPLCASQFLRCGTRSGIQERDTDGERVERQSEVSAGVWQGVR